LRCPICGLSVADHNAELAKDCYRRYLRTVRVTPVRKPYADPGASLWWRYSEDLRSPR
jgi:hypothetical protein